MNEPVKPAPLAGMRHVALFVVNFDECIHFYVDLLGMSIEWKPDEDNIYLTGGCDNLALHRRHENVTAESANQQRLDHIGFIVDEIDQVDQWHDFLLANGVTIKTQPRTHRDGARSFYCLDPEGVLVQLIFHPPISGAKFIR